MYENNVPIGSFTQAPLTITDLALALFAALIAINVISLSLRMLLPRPFR